MSEGIKIVQAGKNINSTSPADVVIDTHVPGSFKIHKIIRFKTTDADSVRQNGFGTNIGTKVIGHGLDFAPPFIAFLYGTGGNNFKTSFEGATVTLPSQSEFGESVPPQAHSDATNVTVSGFQVITPGDIIILVIFRESLDG